MAQTQPSSPAAAATRLAGQSTADRRVTRLLPPQRDSDNPGAGAATRVSRSTRRGGAWHVLITSRSHPEHVAVAVASGRVQVMSQAVLILCSSAPASAVGQMDSRKTG